MKLTDKIFVAGHRGLVGSAIVRQLKNKGYDNLVFRMHKELDLTQQQAVNDFFHQEKPDYVFLSAAQVGGIHANNTYPVRFIYDNLMMQNNIIQASYANDVTRLLFLGSSCIYPKYAEQPMAEKQLLTGTLEPTNEPYAIAKIAGIKTCESYNRQYGTDFRSVMPTNLYGPNDNFHLENSHVIPALIRKYHQAKVNQEPHVTLWGAPEVQREFLHVDDMADASIFVMALDKDHYQAHTEPMLSHINVGTGVDVTIAELAKTIGEVVGYPCESVYDPERPPGAPRKLLDVTRLNNMGWRANISLPQGLQQTYQWFLQHLHDYRQ